MGSISLDGTHAPLTVAEQLRIALDDPSLRIVYRSSEGGTWADEIGHRVGQSALDTGASVTPLDRDGDWVAALIHDPVLLDDPERLQSACVAVSDLIDTERAVSGLQAQLRDEQASRARILAASDRQRRRFERNLHDGAQQRLVGLALTLQLAGRHAEVDHPVTALLAESVAQLEEAISDLHELARGLHPAIVSDAGLAAALETLAERPGIPVDLAVTLPERLPDLVEVGAFYLVAEALANANKYSGAQSVYVRAQVVGDALEVVVRDDGKGGAVPSGSGSGLVGMTDRVAALGGDLVIESEPGSGTTIAAHVPLQTPAPAALEHVDHILLGVTREDDASERYITGTPRRARSVRGDVDRRRRALKWIVWQNHAGPPEVVDAQPDSEDLLLAKALLLYVGGNRQLQPQRRDWIIGYLTACGYSESVLAAAAAYDDSDTIEQILNLPRMVNVQKVLLYDALRACAMASYGFAPGDFDPVLRAADALGIPREVVANLHEIVLEEARLRQRRHDLIVAPLMPKLLTDSIASMNAMPHRGGESPIFE